jgi:hypothetical protein
MLRLCGHSYGGTDLFASQDNNYRNLTFCIKPLPLPQYLDLLKASGILVFLLPSFTANCQSFSGFVQNEKNEPVPYASIFIQELSSGTNTDEKGRYFIRLDPGNYHVVVSCLGYKPVSMDLIVGDKAVVKNFWLEPASIELREIEVRAKAKDPAYEIIQKAIANKEKYLKQVHTSRTTVYVRAMEVVDPKKSRQKQGDHGEPDDPTGAPADPVADAKKKEEQRLQQINFLEMQLTLNYKSPDSYKEERTAYKLYGTKDGLYIPVFSETNINFYNNLVGLQGISEVPVISPLSRLSILSYKFKLEEMKKEGQHFVYKIKVTPRKSGDATCAGYVFINDSTWNLNRVDLTLTKGGLRFYDGFTIRQEYTKVVDSVWMPVRQEFVYETKAGRRYFRGNTVLVFSNFEKDPKFPPRFFGNEVSVTTQNAYEHDSSFWNSTRPDPLTVDQQKVIRYRDSLEAVHKSKVYIDSMEAKFNKVTIGEVLLHGVGFRNESKKSNVFFSSLANTLGFEVVAGFRFGPYGSYFRTFKNGRNYWTTNSISIGLKNRDLHANTTHWLRYDPVRLGDVSIRIGRTFYSVNSFDAYLNQLKISNYILHEHISGFHRIEILNGLYTSLDVAFHNRKPLTNFDRSSILNEVIDETDPLIFDPYQAFVTQLSVAYTPQQRYMREPNRKVILGSKFPTVTMTHRKGWNKLFTSDIDFDFVEVSLDQRIQIGTLGNSRYNLSSGKFLTMRDLRYVDLKRFRQSDPYLYSDPMHSFQSLDTSLVATGLYLEGHYIHHFNGAMVNNLPLIKKLKLKTVAGAGVMWVKENNYRHEEIFGGVERVFKLGARRRLRIGAYGVLSQSNDTSLKTDYKISFDIIDTWKREWSY